MAFVDECHCPRNVVNDLIGRDPECPFHGDGDLSPAGDPVNHPPHYGGAGDPYEAIKVIEAWELGFCLGNTVKYLARAGKKGDALEDLKKARWYLDREITSLETPT